MLISNRKKKMPTEFDTCVKSGGKVRTVSGPSEKTIPGTKTKLKKNEYIRVCIDADGGRHWGEIKTKETKKAILPTLYGLHRRAHLLWTNKKLDTSTTIVLHDIVLREYEKYNLIHNDIDLLDDENKRHKEVLLSDSFTKGMYRDSKQSSTSFEYALYCKFFNCQVKDIYQNSFELAGPLKGTYLAGSKSIFSSFKLLETRSFNWNGQEQPPQYKVISLNSKKSDDFLVSGTAFYQVDETKKIIAKYSPTFFGIEVSFISHANDKEWNKSLVSTLHSWVKTNNHLKNEKFSLTGKFIEKTDETWDDIVLNEDIKKAVIRVEKVLTKDGKDSKSRGLLFMGPPGTGKTLSGRILMNKLDSTFIWVSSKDFREMNPIDSLALAFELARDLAPTVLFIEDIDTWLRSYIVDLLKTELDGLTQNTGVVTILTSNHPESLPDALLDRPGRFHDVLKFDLPTEESRRKILEKFVDGLDKDIIDDIVKKTEGFSCAHMRELIDFAKISVEDEDIKMEKAIVQSLGKLQRQRQLIEEIKSESEKVDDAKSEELC